MKNNYGNYVIQKALKLTQNENRKKLVENVSKNVERLGEKKIIEKWKAILIPYTASEFDATPFQKKNSVRTSKYVLQTTMIEAPQEFNKSYQTPKEMNTNNLFISGKNSSHKKKSPKMKLSNSPRLSTDNQNHYTSSGPVRIQPLEYVQLPQKRKSDKTNDNSNSIYFDFI